MPAQWETLILMSENSIFRDKIGFGEYCILQDREYFSYGVDAVILADFAAGFINDKDSAIGIGKSKNSIQQKYDKLAIDIGTGTGVIPLILAHKTRLDKIIGLDIEEYFVQLARKSASENDLEGRVYYECCDVRDVDSLEFGSISRCIELKKSNGRKLKCDFVLCNPPYFKADASIPSKNLINDAARREVKGCLRDFTFFASNLLERGGEFFLVHRPERLIDVFESLRAFELEPRDIRFVSSKIDGEPKFVLIRSIKNGGQNLRFMKPLAIYEDDGSYTSELLKIYERDY